MNKRLRELIEICTNVDSIGIDETLYYSFDKEKFAELIVRECSDKIERDYKYERGEDTKWIIAFAIANDLKAHFGVEE